MRCVFTVWGSILLLENVIKSCTRAVSRCGRRRLCYVLSNFKIKDTSGKVVKKRVQDQSQYIIISEKIKRKKENIHNHNSNNKVTYGTEVTAHSTTSMLAVTQEQHLKNQ